MDSLSLSYCNDSQKNNLLYNVTANCHICSNHSSGRFLVLELVILGRITLFTGLKQTAMIAETGKRGWQVALGEILRPVTVPGFIILKRLYYLSLFFLNLNMTMALK
jgi:hypothetical protein